MALISGATGGGSGTAPRDYRWGMRQAWGWAIPEPRRAEIEARRWTARAAAAVQREAQQRMAERRRLEAAAGRWEGPAVASLTGRPTAYWGDREIRPAWIAEHPLIRPPAPPITEFKVPLARAIGLREEIFEQAGISPEARAYLRTLPVVIRQPRMTGGGFFHPTGAYTPGGWVELYSPQPEAAIHEYSHAWFQTHLPWWREQFEEAFNRYGRQAGEAAARGWRLPRARQLALEYIYGTPEWPGIYAAAEQYSPDWARWLAQHEMYAGMASGLMGQTWQLPAWLRQYYAGLFPEERP